MNTCKECIHAEMCKLIDELEGRGCDFFDGEQEPKKLNCTLEDFKQFTLENNYALLTTELYSQMITEREWISPKDKLPDDMTRVLVTIKTRSRIAVRSGTYYDGHFSLDNGDCWLTRDKEVRGWMKCPEPYERGGK